MDATRNSAPWIDPTYGAYGHDVDLPSVIVARDGRLGIYFPSVCPSTDAIVGGHFEAAPASQQYGFRCARWIQARKDAAAEAARIAADGPEPF